MTLDRLTEWDATAASWGHPHKWDTYRIATISGRDSASTHRRGHVPTPPRPACNNETPSALTTSTRDSGWTHRRGHVPTPPRPARSNETPSALTTSTRECRSTTEGDACRRLLDPPAVMKHVSSLRRRRVTLDRPQQETPADVSYSPPSSAAMKHVAPLRLRYVTLD